MIGIDTTGTTSATPRTILKAPTIDARTGSNYVAGVT